MGDGMGDSPGGKFCKDAFPLFPGDNLPTDKMNGCCHIKNPENFLFFTIYHH
jgi:hypothetical protein